MQRNICLALFTILLSSNYFGQIPEKFKKINWRVYHSLNATKFVDYESEEWKNMSYEDKDFLLQIPKEELQKMSTKELIEAYLINDIYNSF
ncbi:MAG: hypothetical protein JEY94_11825 [Melioribacteraceae bacterium]|nr:hypothetical protein [Melioribacteraceae bacterium]